TAARGPPPGSAVPPAGRRPGAPPPAPATGGLLPPAHGGPVTDPARLRAALGEAARLIAAADRRR
ncbi:hypothetical protein ACFW6Z_15315, partial [Streptomyces albidoflavus]